MDLYRIANWIPIVTATEEMQVQLAQEIDQILETIEYSLENKTQYLYSFHCIRDDLYRKYIHFIEQTIAQVSEALLQPEDDDKKRTELLDACQMIFDAFLVRCKQTSRHIEALLQNICQSDFDFEKKCSTSSVLVFGTFTTLIILKAITFMIDATSYTPRLLEGIHTVSLVAAVATFAVASYNWCFPSPQVRGNFIVDISAAHEISLKLNKLVQTCRIDRTVWFRNELLERVLNNLKSVKVKLEDLHKDQATA